MRKYWTYLDALFFFFGVDNFSVPYDQLGIVQFAREVTIFSNAFVRAQGCVGGVCFFMLFLQGFLDINRSHTCTAAGTDCPGQASTMKV